MVEGTYTGPDVWVGSELGVLKGVTFANGTFVNYGSLKSLNKSQAVTTMTRQTLDSGGERIVFGTREGSARIYETHTNEFSDPLCCGSSPVCGVIGLPDGSMMTCTEKGLLKQWKENQSVCEKKIGSNIQTMVANTTQTLIAAGGEENDLKLWNIESMEKPVFLAKNVRNDFLNLRVPVCVKAAEFFNESDHEIVIGTGNHTVRTYDTRTKRRPVLEVGYHEHPITAIALTRENKTVIVGNSAGFMGELDLRAGGKQVGGFKGICASIRAISCHASQPYVVTCGLDRFVRVYDAKTRILEKKVYLKSNVNCMALSQRDMELHQQTDSRKRTSPDEDEVEVKEEEEDEDVWEGMKVIKEKKRKTNEHVIDAL